MIPTILDLEYLVVYLVKLCQNDEKLMLLMNTIYTFEIE